MSLKEKLNTNREFMKRWIRIGDRWSRRATFWKWLYDHNIFKEKAKAMNKQCVEEAKAFYEAAIKLVELSFELIEKTHVIEEES